MKRFATCVAVICSVDTARVSFKMRSFLTEMY